MLWFHWTIVLLIPPMLIALYAQMKVMSTYGKFSKVPNKRGVSGAEFAQAMLYSKGITDVQIETAQGGTLSDHYDPSKQVLRLSPDVYAGRSVAAIGIAAHEAGHAIQHAKGYAPLAIRSLTVPMASVGSNLAFFIFFIGLIFGSNPFLLSLGIGLFSFVVFFTLVTLPVEFNASTRAVAALTESGIIDYDEEAGVRSVLNAAAWTYVAAALMAIAHLLRMILIARD